MHDSPPNRQRGRDEHRIAIEWLSHRLLLVTGAPLACSDRLATARVYELATLNTDQIRALDRTHTVIVVPGGIMEEHGPYLPRTRTATRTRGTPRISRVPSPAARDGLQSSFPPFHSAREARIRSAESLHFQGRSPYDPRPCEASSWTSATSSESKAFGGFLIVHIHGGPEHNRALDDAGDYFRDTYGGRMVQSGRPRHRIGSGR